MLKEGDGSGHSAIKNGGSFLKYCRKSKCNKSEWASMHSNHFYPHIHRILSKNKFNPLIRISHELILKLNLSLFITNKSHSFFLQVFLFGFFVFVIPQILILMNQDENSHNIRSYFASSPS